VVDEECGINEFLSQINPTQEAWTSIQKTKSMVMLTFNFYDKYILTKYYLYGIPVYPHQQT